MKCQHCSADTNGVVLCTRCRTTAEVSLGNLAAYHGDLFSLGGEVPRVRRRSGPSDPTGSAASEDRKDTPVEAAAVETTAMLSGWVRILLDDRPQLSCPADSVASMAAFLRQHMRTVVVLEWAGELMREVLRFEHRLHRLVSAKQGSWYAGICGATTGDGPDDWCPQDLFVHPGDRFVRCYGCGAHWSVSERRRQVIEQAREALLPVAVIARAAVTLLDGEPSQQRLEARLRKWVERQELDDYGVRVLDGKPRRVYRLGDVIDRLTREARPTSQKTPA
jgi:hypothetical protein